LLGARLEDVAELKEPFHCLGISYSYLVMAGRLLFFCRASADIREPVPKGKEDEAKGVLAQLKPK